MPQNEPRADEHEDLETIIELLEMNLNMTGSLQAARAYALKLRFPPEQVERAIRVLHGRRRLFEDLHPGPISDNGRGRWYHGISDKTSRYWAAYSRRLRDSGWNETMVAKLDATTSRAMDELDPPGNSAFRTRGLVFGRVQSGKTAHFAGVAAKAADCGYRLVIVLSGVTNGLRLQTQKRLERDLSEGGATWFWLTRRAIDGDFDVQPGPNVEWCLGPTGNHRTIAVVKKQSVVLRRLIDWLAGSNGIVRRECPVLVIDDEADQASINTGKSMDPAELSRINDRVVELVSMFTKCAYVGYTATPYANVLTDPSYPENLYPRSFIYPLDPPPEYFGASRIHGRGRIRPSDSDEVTDGLPLIRIVPDAELPNLRPAGRLMTGFVFKATPALVEAMRYFVMATAARLQRESRGLDAMDFSTMLIHTSHRVAVHGQTKPAVLEVLNRFGQELHQGRLEEWERQWQHEMAAIDREKLGGGLEEIAFADVASNIGAVLDRVKVTVSNSIRNVESNVLFEERGQILIVIGGNTLSRGLTLEGLVASFFVRSANAYDTILQMGRWFGYRSGYEDLPRIWMTGEMADHFFDLATVEEEVREQMEMHRARGLSPLDVALRIRRLPRITITAPSKMRYAIHASVSYEGARPQTIYFFRRDKTWLDANIEATKRLLAVLGAPRKLGTRRVWRGVESRLILDFLGGYSFHPRSRDLDRDMLSKYIAGQNEVDGLLDWNVVLMGIEDGHAGLGELRLRDDLSVGCMNRSRLHLGDESTANIKALMSKVDIVADREEFDEEHIADRSAAELFALRGPDSPGVLILYPISKDSRPKEPTPPTSQRVGMDAVQHIVGAAFIFPPARGLFGRHDYVQADLKPDHAVVSSEPEDEDDEEEGTA